MGLEAKKRDSTYIILSGVRDPSVMKGEHWKFARRFAAIKLNQNRELKGIFINGRQLVWKRMKVEMNKEIKGTIMEVDYTSGELTVSLPIRDVGNLEGEMALIASQGHYDGAVLVDGEGREARIERIRNGEISISGDTGNLTPGEVEIWEYGPGDTVRLNTCFSAELDQDRLKGTSNVGFKMDVGHSTRKVGPGRFENIFDDPLRVLYK